MQNPFELITDRLNLITDKVGSLETLILQTQKKESEKLLSADEARKLFAPAISKPTIIRWTADGLLTCHRIGGRVFYLQSEVLAAVTKLKKYSQKTPTA